MTQSGTRTRPGLLRRCVTQRTPHLVKQPATVRNGRRVRDGHRTCRKASESRDLGKVRKARDHTPRVRVKRIFRKRIELAIRVRIVFRWKHGIRYSDFAPVRAGSNPFEPCTLAFPKESSHTTV